MILGVLQNRDRLKEYYLVVPPVPDRRELICVLDDWGYKFPAECDFCQIHKLAESTFC